MVLTSVTTQRMSRESILIVFLFKHQYLGGSLLTHRWISRPVKDLLLRSLSYISAKIRGGAVPIYVFFFSVRFPVKLQNEWTNE